MKRVVFLLGVFPAVFLAQEKADSIGVNQIKEVVVVKKKPIVQSSKGYQLNVSGTILEQKENVSEILKHSPNISFVDGIKVMGSSKIQIILNNKEVKISPEQFETFFSSLDAKTIKSIDINDVSEASLDSRYTAQILIYTKKIEGHVLNLGTGLYYNGKSGHNSNASYMASLGKAKIYISGDYFVNKNKIRGNSFQDWEQKILREGVYEGAVNRFGNSATLNVDYDFNDNHRLSFLYNYTADMDLDKNYKYHYTNRNLNSLGESYMSNFSETKDKTNTFSLQYNISLDNGGELDLNVDYALENFNNPFDSYNDFYSNNLLLRSDNYTQKSNLYYKIFTTSVDYTKNINSNNKLILGGKYSNSSNENIIDYYSFGNFIENRSQRFNFNENIYSFYLNYFLTKGKIRYNLGVRDEYTTANYYTDKGIKGNISYNKLLPFITIRYIHDKNHVFYVHGSNRFSRPSFFSYDPTIVIEQTDVWSSGNEYIKPVNQYISQMGYILKGKYSFVLRYMYSEDNIVNVSNLMNNNVLFSKLENGGYQNSVLFNIGFPFRITKFWNTNNKVNLFYNNFSFKKYDLYTKSYYATLESIHSFDIMKKMSVDVSLNYSTPSRQQFSYKENNFQADLSLRIPLFERKANLSLRVTDVFNTSRFRGYTSINDIYTYNYTKNTSRGVSLKFSYQFKAGKEIDDEIRDTKIDDLLERTGK